MRNLQQRFLSLYSIDEQALTQLLRSFYCLLLVVDFWCFEHLLNPHDLVGAHWLWPVSWLQFFAGEELKMILVGLLMLTMAIHGLCMLFPHRRAFKFLGSVVLFLCMAANYSFGKINHDIYGVLFASIGLAFIRPSANKSPRYAEQNQFFLWAAQLTVLGTYSLSGLWKVRDLWNHFTSGDLAWGNPLIVNIAWSYIENYAPGFNSIFENAPGISLTIWILIVIFALALPLAAWMPRYQRMVGLSVIFLHALTSYFMGLYFTPAALLAGILFCTHPYVKKSKLVE